MMTSQYDVVKKLLVMLCCSAVSTPGCVSIILRKSTVIHVLDDVIVTQLHRSMTSSWDVLLNTCVNVPVVHIYMLCISHCSSPPPLFIYVHSLWIAILFCSRLLKNWTTHWHGSGEREIEGQIAVPIWRMVLNWVLVGNMMYALDGCSTKSCNGQPYVLSL